jgi:S-adenosylmethionine decarboxylase
VKLRTTQINLYKCDEQKLSSIETCERFLVELVDFIEMNIIPSESIGSKNPITFEFDAAKHKLAVDDDGVTGVVILCESHCAIHTWPKKDGFICIVITSCREYDPQSAMAFSYRFFEAKESCYETMLL